MSASADKPKQACAKCGALLQLFGQFSDLCAACLLELGWEEEVRTANAERFDHYHVATHTDGTPVELGRGAMGITYRASDTILGNEVALKVIDARIAALPEARERFLREARAAARLRHPNIASVFYYGTRKSDGQCFYAMELVEGETLETRLRHSGPLPPSLALEVITQAARALWSLFHFQSKRSTLPATVSYEFFIRITLSPNKFWKCLAPLEVCGIWCMCGCQTMQHAAFRRGCLMRQFARASVTQILQ
jgi:Protein kinase domain